ncbi:MAG TPA: undecaprenyl-diphosphate phosphatase [Gammaproteobacteria bacterium]|nr:undecaprenyl-diphosphate phosphatase [Gammaproteobacteria bacterium]
MNLLHLIVLAVVQGLTEFLPVSSDAHLILVPHLLGWPDQGLAFDVAVHVGTLAAVLWYFRAELAGMARSWAAAPDPRSAAGDARLAWAVVLGTVPVGLAGLLLRDFVAHSLRTPAVIAWATIGFALVLWLADILGRRRRTEHQLRWSDVLWIGCAQTLALIPGASRSGTTMTAGRALGLTREGAARFSFLLSIPVIFLAGALETLELLRGGHPVAWGELALAALVAAVTAYVCIRVFLRLLERVGMLPFVIYRLVLGPLVLLLA